MKSAFFGGQQIADQVVRQAGFVVFQNLGRGMRLQNILVGVDRETAGAARQVANALARARRQHLHHHADDMARRAELPVAPGGVELAEQVFVQVPLHVLVLLRDLHLVDQLAGFDQQGWLADLALGVGHVALERAARRPQLAQVGKDHFFQMAQSFLGFQVRPIAPAQVLRQAGGVGLPQLLGQLFASVLCVVHALEEEQVRKLLDGVQRVGQAARPELVPQRVDLRFKFGVGKHKFSGFLLDVVDALDILEMGILGPQRGLVSASRCQDQAVGHRQLVSDRNQGGFDSNSTIQLHHLPATTSRQYF